MKGGKNIAEVTLLSKGMKLAGDLQSLSDIRIEGEISGSVITLGKVIVSEEATVMGDISAFSLEVYGKLRGNISIDDHVILGKESDFEGDIVCKSIEISKGCKFMGKIHSHDRMLNERATVPDEKVVTIKPFKLQQVEISKEEQQEGKKEVYKKAANGFGDNIDFGGNPTSNGFF